LTTKFSFDILNAQLNMALKEKGKRPRAPEPVSEKIHTESKKHIQGNLNLCQG